MEVYEGDTTADSKVNIGIWLEKSGDGASLYLDDFEVTAELQLNWMGLSLKLIDTAANEVEKLNQACRITDERLIPIIVENEIVDNFEPAAVISRDGHITLKNMPITAK